MLKFIIFMLTGAFFAYLEAFFISPKEKRYPKELLEGEEYRDAEKKMCALIKEMKGICGERVSIRGYDGKKLSGTYYHVQDGAPVQIQIHGYKGTAIRDFCGGNKIAREAGHNTLVIEQRAHGESEGNTITFGIKERYDCVSWARYVRKRFGKETPIFLAGVSMGASTVLMASGLKLPDNVVGIIADCPYSSPEQIIRKVCGDRRLPHKIIFPFIWLGGKIFGRFDVKETDVLQAVRKKKVPILIIHGEEDRFVPCEMSKEIYAAAREPKRLELFPNAGHGLSYIIDTDRYEKIVHEFTEECLKNPSPYNTPQPQVY